MPKKPVEKKLSRTDQRNLDVEISFIEGVVRRDPGYVDALQILGDDYTKRGRFADGLTVDEQLAKLRPHDATVLYNLACSYSLTDRLDEALDALHRAIGAGYKEFTWLTKDPDLEAVRQHPDFEKVRAKIKAAKSRDKSA
jgi:tetratricopeptide (TPR) repeat protein